MFLFLGTILIYEKEGLFMAFTEDNNMEFIIETSDFQNIVKLLSVTAKNNASDISGRILIEATPEELTFVADNRSNSLLISANKFNVVQPGKCSVSYSQIKSFVSSFSPWNEEESVGLKEFHLSYKSKEDSLIINVDNVYENGKTSAGQVEFKGYDPDIFERPESFNNETFNINSSIFRRALSKVLYAIDPNSHLPAIRNMNISFDEDSICFVGTNGTVISEYSIKNISNLKEGNFVIKYDFIMGLRRAIGDETQLYFEFTDKKIKVKFNNVLYSGSISSNNMFPVYKPMFDEYKHTISLSKEMLKGSLLPFSDLLNAEDYNRLTLAIKDRKIFLVNDLMDFEYSDDIDFDDEFIIDIDGNVLIQSILSTEDDMLYIKFSSADKYIILDSFNFQNQKTLIMPINRR